jgi:hypothetical protein
MLALSQAMTVSTQPKEKNATVVTKARMESKVILRMFSEVTGNR